MSRQTFPIFMDQPGCTQRNFRIDGSAVGATAGTSGLDGRGMFLCTISKSTNVVTINWTAAFAEAPYIFFENDVGQQDTEVEIISSSGSQLVFQTVKSSDRTTGVNDADLMVHVDSYDTTSYVS